jgi:hypothetical protein
MAKDLTIGELTSVSTYSESENNNWTTRLIFDPENNHLYQDEKHGTGETFSIWHNREIPIATIPNGTTKESLKNFVAEIKPIVEKIADCWLGTYWDGNNHKGNWSENTSDLIDEIEGKIYENTFQIAWNPEEWLGQESLCDLLKAIAKHETPEKWVETDNDYDQPDCTVDPSELQTYVERLIEKTEIEAIINPIEKRWLIEIDSEYWRDTTELDLEYIDEDQAKATLCGMFGVDPNQITIELED